MTKIKTARKEELRSNKLIDALGSIGEGLKKNVGFIALGAAVIVVAIVIFWRFTSEQAKKEGALAGNAFQYSRTLTAEWLAYGSAQVTLESFREASEQASDTDLAARSLLAYGNALLLAANTDPKLSRATAEAATARRGMVDQADAVFRRALSGKGRTGTTDALAQLGLSSVARNLGDFARAKEHAEAAKGAENASPFSVKMAEKALEWIEQNREPVTLAASRPAETEATVPIPFDLPIFDQPDVPLVGTEAAPVTVPALPAPQP